ncbi:hypothetical protein ACFSKU_21345 [Pontibacter silvestris]|uniref:Uncharacterized protein n=1 Tax=Pontibacter silvestris TaxID=2305183 RepID=A0ABW4X5L4_9BACT|nr:hypothetical protein [Pontibacter silvestris]MCC9137900.1 hypothetical protein [Pontibacter silvestris]
MLKPLLEIRLKQILRAQKGLHWYHYIIFGGLLLYLVIWLYNLLLQRNSAIVVAATSLLPILALQMHRNDKRFVSHLSHFPYLIFWVEYTLLLSPLLLLYTFTASWFLICPVILALLPISNFGLELPKPRKAIPLVFIADACFEWKAGVRKNKWLLCILYVAAFALCLYPFGSLLILWFSTAIISTFYQRCEPVNLLTVPEKGAKAFLYYKLKANLKQFMVLTLPLLLLYSLLHPDHMVPALVFYPLLLLVLVSSILAKYAYYEPNNTVSSAASFLNSIDILSPLLPFLLLFPLISSIRNYKKAVHRLNLYLHDFN